MSNGKDMKLKRLLIKSQERVLVDIAFDIEGSVALVGQSGSGKSLTLKALLGMLPSSLACEIEIEADFELRAGRSVALVPQNPFTALSPLTKIKDQFFVSFERVQELFGMLDLPLELLERYPPELSGGQLQRIVIAMALESEPKLLLLDEPTTALDPKTRERILQLLLKLHQELGFAMLFVTHDINSAAVICHNIVVIKNGTVVESGITEEILRSPQSRYTQTLIESNFKNRNFRQ